MQVVFVLRNGEKKTVEANAGQTLLDVAKQYDLDVEGACGGAMACSTCHMIVDAGWYKKLPPASDDEMDMLDLAPGLTRTSRLGCQIKLTDAMNGLTVTLPQSTNSLLG
jgi:ferredoxin